MDLCHCIPHNGRNFMEGSGLRRWSAGQLVITLLLSVALWAVPAFFCLMVGSTGIHWPGGYQFDFRLRLVLMASLIGAALAGAGVAYQAILRNPLADPYLLGVSSGASLLAYVWHFAWGGALLASAAAAMGQQGFAFAGALLAVAIVFMLASRRGRLEPITLLLVGVIVNAIAGSIFLLLNAINKEMSPGTGGAFAFLVGGIQTNLTSQQQWTATVVVGIGWIILFALTGRLNVAGLSESEAQALGVRIHRLRWSALIVASLVTAAAVSVSGPIGFVGLVCPHLGRLIVGNDQRRLLPISTALGAGLLALADAASRGLIQDAQTWLPVGVLTALLGGPFFLLLLYQSRGTGLKS
jgi:iron complex transport system permease protein